MAEQDPDVQPQCIVDAHLDLAYNAVVLGRDLTQPVAAIREQERQSPPPDPQAGTCTVSWPALLDGHIKVVGATLFVEPGRKSRRRPIPTYQTPDEARDLAVAQLDYYRRMCDEREEIRCITNSADLEALLSPSTPQVGLFIVMEGADPITRPDALGWWVERGLRGVALSWATGSRYAGGNAAPGPLTDEGRALLREMADFNLLLDISHLWEDAAYRAVDLYPGPIAATHANPRALVDTPRQLPDDLIRQIAERGGVIGVVANNGMLIPGWTRNSPRPPLARLAEAIDHICQITGHAQAVGLGSDLDGGFGVESTPEGLDTIADLGKVGALLASRGYEAADIEAVLTGNWARVMRAVLQAF